VPGHPNSLAPGKRPLHTIIPALATRDGALWAVFGVMGALMQPQGQAQLLINLLDCGVSPQEAVDHPRHRHEDGTLFLEGRVDEVEVERLEEMGHRVEVGADYIIPTGGAQLIRVLESRERRPGVRERSPQGRLRARAVGGGERS
jgi:gamma-glutamyltranspeptidase/glutathione hydrolase